MKKIKKTSLKSFLLGVILSTILMSTAFGSQLRSSIDVVFNSINISVNGVKQDVDHLIYKDTTYLPLRTLGEIFDKEISWDGESKTANIYDRRMGYGENYQKISKYMKDESIAAYSPYYELLDFQISNYKEKLVDGKLEATFFYKIIDKNYDKDPDTVGYIKELKESGHRDYQQLYDEYLQPKESNYELKIIIDEDDKITLYSNASPNSIEWVETKMSDYILKD